MRVNPLKDQCVTHFSNAVSKITKKREAQAKAQIDLQLILQNAKQRLSIYGEE